MDFNRFEEFGEFETEIEKGGEVIVEKLAAVFSIQPYLLQKNHIIFTEIGCICTFRLL